MTIPELNAAIDKATGTHRGNITYDRHEWSKLLEELVNDGYITIEKEYLGPGKHGYMLIQMSAGEAGDEPFWRGETLGEAVCRAWLAVFGEKK